MRFDPKTHRFVRSNSRRPAQPCLEVHVDRLFTTADGVHARVRWGNGKSDELRLVDGDRFQADLVPGWCVRIAKTALVELADELRAVSVGWASFEFHTGEVVTHDGEVHARLTQFWRTKTEFQPWRVAA